MLGDIYGDEPPRKPSCCRACGGFCVAPVLIGLFGALALTICIASMQDLFWSFEGSMQAAWMAPAILMVVVALTETTVLVCQRPRKEAQTHPTATFANLPIEFHLQLVQQSSQEEIMERPASPRWTPAEEDADKVPEPRRASARRLSCSAAGCFSRRCAVGACGISCSVMCGVLIGTVLFLSGVLTARATGPLHLDDVTPTEIPCRGLSHYRHQPARWVSGHKRFLWIIPNYEGVNITSNRTFCTEMMRLRDEEGFTLGMHGVTHALGEDGDQEFQDISDELARQKIAYGVAIWEDAFNGSAPEHFSFPGEWGTLYTVNLLQKTYGMTVRSLIDGLLNKLYHCDDSFCCDTCFCSAWFQDTF